MRKFVRIKKNVICIDIEYGTQFNEYFILDKNYNLIKSNHRGQNYLRVHYDTHDNPIRIDFTSKVYSFHTGMPTLDRLTTEFEWDHHRNLTQYQDSLGNYWNKKLFQFKPTYIQMDNIKEMIRTNLKLINHFGDYTENNDIQTLLLMLNEKNTHLHLLMDSLHNPTRTLHY